MIVPSNETITTIETKIATTYGHFGLSICSGGTVGGAGAIGTSGWDAVMELRTRERRSAQRTGALPRSRAPRARRRVSPADDGGYWPGRGADISCAWTTKRWAELPIG